jgi:hypothetical protein
MLLKHSEILLIVPELIAGKRSFLTYYFNVPTRVLLKGQGKGKVKISLLQAVEAPRVARG